MESLENQGVLFPLNQHNIESPNKNEDIILSSDLLIKWRNSVSNFQSNLFQEKDSSNKQSDLFEETFIEKIEDLNPLELEPLSLSFWRFQSAPHRGAALYFVIDQPKDLKSPLLLYIGETISAERRWKGDHDCKRYLSAYSESLNKAKINYQLSIRFFADVPQKTSARRKVEQILIKKWQPPFNKETRDRWKTPFTSDF